MARIDVNFTGYGNFLSPILEVHPLTGSWWIFCVRHQRIYAPRMNRAQLTLLLRFHCGDDPPKPKRPRALSTKRLSCP